jgi:primosomal protein N' (replication factor Y)
MFFTIHLGQDKSKISPYISSTLLDEIGKTITQGEKVLLYLNKRGAFSSMICEDCQYLFECPNCDISLGVHHNPEHFLCHLCQHSYRIPAACSKCQWTKLKSIWIGTQQIEGVLKKYFEWTNTSLYRFDSDSMKNISSKKAALWELENADIIIGTKMITTGFDFEKIGLIGVILVEGELWYASYDAEESAYSNLKQLIWRWNRKSQDTKILLQSFIPKNPTIQRLTQNNFKDFISETLKERKEYLYPPYTQMVRLEYRHKESVQALTYIKNLEKTLIEYNSLETYHFLCGTSTFKKNNTHHVSLIIKWDNIRDLLKHIKKTILSERNLSVIFS